jgi:LuxR family quorum-sensing system transcriptional regulator CciR
MAQLVGPFAFEAARKIIRRYQGRSRPTSGGRLTPRQLDCVLLVARGKTNREIAADLGIKPDTVVEYLEEARRHYEARNRTDLAFRAVYDGAFTLSDVLKADPR